MKKNEISIQLYTVRKFKPFNEVLDFISNSGISNIELFGLESINVGSIKDSLESNNLLCRSAHTSYESIHDYNEIIHRAKLLNIKHVIVPAPPKKNDGDFKSSFDINEPDWISFGKKLSSYVPIFEDNGLTLGYHNHSYEFISLPSGKLPIECVMDQSENLKFEIDLGWTTAGGADPNIWVERYVNKIIACHLKDFYFKDKDMLDHNNQSAVGDGFINWKELINKLKKTNCNLFIIEHDDPQDYKNYINKSLANLSSI